MKTALLPFLIGVSIVMATPVYADFTDSMTSTDPNVSLWSISNGWSNGYPFDTCWKSTQFSRTAGIGSFGLVSSTACAETTIGPEYRTNGYYGYGTYSFSMKAATQASGVVMGAFVYRGPYDNNNGNPAHNEIDIEFLKGGVQFNYYHNNIGGHEVFLTAAQLGFNPSADFHTYSFSWQADTIKFLVDGVVKATKTTDIPVITDGGMKIVMNLWKCMASTWCGVAPGTVNTTGFVDWVKYTVK
jgi:endo-1,3-1,4-beta-glycanase ExoK